MASLIVALANDGDVKTGDIVGFRDGMEAPAPADDGILRVPLLALSSARDLTKPWRYELRVEGVLRDVAEDSWRFRLENRWRRSSDGEATLPDERVGGVVLGWGAELVGLDPTGPVLDWSVTAGVRSPQFRLTELTEGWTFTEISYVQETGGHLYEIVAPPEATQEEITSLLVQIQRRKVGEPPYRVADRTWRFSVERQLILRVFRSAVESAANGVHLPHRWRVSDAIVTDLNNASGDLSIGVARLANNLVDKIAL